MTAVKNNKAYAALVTVSIFWGTTWLPSKLAVGMMPAFQLAGIRQATAGVLFILLFLIQGKAMPTMRQMGRLFILSIFFLVISNGLALVALRHLESGIGALLGATVPLWIALLNIFFLRSQKLNAYIITGILLGFGGIVVVFNKDVQKLFNPDYEWGILLSLIASISWSVGTLFNAKKGNTLNPFVALGWQMLFSGIMLLCIAFFTGQTIPLLQIPANAWWCILYLLVIGSMLTFVAYIYALKHLPTSLVSVYAYINPIIALILGAIFLREPLSLFVIIGGAVTLVGVFLVNIGFRK
jgi:drug/metabolite transporter (DMT)-like permease